ncbi:MAG: InlB B-repeat-containing protein [Clostridia bacterium]|nr:InlB B-repeat-containing protein [Clostridia bacterium]
MRTIIKKSFCVFITVLMLLTALPVMSIASEIADINAEAYKLNKQNAAWKQFEEVEKKALDKGATPKEITLAVYKAVLSHKDVDKGSLEWDGENQFIFTIDGMHSVYCYRVRNTNYTSTIAGKMTDSLKTMIMESSGGGNILLVEPYYGQDSIFTDDYFVQSQLLADYTGGAVTALVGSEATGPAIAANCVGKDIIFVHSHGARVDNSTYIYISNISGLTQNDYSRGWAICLGTNLAFIDGRYIKNHIPAQLSNCFIWMTICEGMALSTTGNALLEAGAGCVYGYSEVVTVKYDALCEQLFWSDMRNGATTAEAVADIKTTIGAYDPYYSTQARPVVVSPVDSYPTNSYFTQTVNCTWTLPQGAATPTATPTADPSAAPTATPTATPTPVPTATPTPAPTVAPSTTYYMPVTTIETNEDYLIGYDDGTNIYLLMNSNPNYNSVSGGYQYYYSANSKQYSYGIKAQRIGENVIDVDNSTYASATLNNVTWRFVSASGGYYIQSAADSGKYLYFIAADSLVPYKSKTAWNYSNGRLTAYSYNVCYLGTVGAYSNFFATGTSAGSNTNLKLYKKTVAAPVTNYTVTFKDWNGTVLKTEQVAEGGSATAPNNPTRTGYTFTGWDTAFNNITADTVVTAQYTINSYTVTFKDWDGTTLKTQTVNYGGSATAPANPTRTGYAFTGWDKAFDNITANTVVTAQYTINTYTVTFKDWDGTTLKTQTVNYGGSATAPVNPTRTGYTFTGWDKAFNNITANTVVNAQYTINSYTVTFKDWDGTTLKTQTVNYGGSATAPANPTRTGYTFTGWDKAFNNITANTVVTAQYTINTYTVTFKDWDGTVLKTQTVNYGGAATAPNNPTREGYTFTGWDKTFNNITADTVVTAQYTQNAVVNYYTVTFKDWDGTVLKTEQVAEGGAATAPNNPTRTGYTFTGWDKAFNNITANTVVTAQYTQNAATDKYMPAVSIVEGKDYVLGYNDGKNVYLIMNYNADPLTSVYETSSYRYIYSSTYYAYGVKAVLDSSGNVIDVDRSIYSNACVENMKWNFITTSKGYKIRSAKEPSMYLRAHANSKYAHLFVSSGYYNATDWNWNYSQRLMSYKLSGGVTKYISYVPTVNGYQNFFKAGTAVGTVVLYRRVEQISSYVVSNDMSNAGLCMNVN